MIKLLVIVGGVLALVILSLFIIPIKTKTLGYCDKAHLVQKHYTIIYGETAVYDQLITGDTTGLLCNGGTIKVGLYIL